ncbi:hypothetical protein [Phytohalomonas tamaricis]|uniref:hypothetical protein n=1 Tax=Phytohalomonas tamaricis TaxID=2081032 RepID=UPI000D0ACA6F|nr:hypothetical protein [Phytohalomonas tamaricis]
MQSLGKLMGEVVTLVILVFNAMGHTSQPIDINPATQTIIKRGENVVIFMTDALPLASAVVSDARRTAVIQQFSTLTLPEEHTLLAGRVPFSNIRLRIALSKT